MTKVSDFSSLNKAQEHDVPMFTCGFFFLNNVFVVTLLFITLGYYLLKKATFKQMNLLAQKLTLVSPRLEATSICI